MDNSSPEWHLYSDVATLRSPSPSWDREYPSARAGDTGTQVLRVASTTGVSNNTKYIFSSAMANHEINEGTSKEQESGSPWQTINRQCACSLDSAEIAHKETGQRGQNPKRKILTATMKLSSMGPTATEIMGQPKAVQPQHNTLVESHCEGPSQPKNRGPDPRDWGNVQLDKSEMDAVLQQAAYKSYKEQGQYENQQKKCEHCWMTNREQGPSQQQTRPPESHPLAQIAPDSFLRVALRNLERQGDPSDNPAPRSSSLSERDSDKSPSETSSYSSRSMRLRHQHQWHQSKSKARKGRSDLKPIPPKIYNGSANAQAYHWSMWESESYLQDGRVWGTWQSVHFIPFSWGKGLWLLYPKGSHQWARLAYALLFQGVIWLLFSYRFQNADQKKVSMLFTRRMYHNRIFSWVARALQHDWNSLWMGPSSAILQWGETKSPVMTLESTLESGNIQLGWSIGPGQNNWDIQECSSLT